MTLKIFLLNFPGGVKMREKKAISAYIFEKRRKGPIFKTSNGAKETFS